MGYWLKSYTDILDDPKYHRLSERAQLAMHEIFLVAKMIETDELTGLLPSIQDIAFFSRKPVEYWDEAMPELIKAGIVTEQGNGFLVVNYVKRQQAIPDDERARQYRKRRNDQRMADDNGDETEQSQECNGNLTNRDGEKSKSTEKSREEAEKEVEKRQNHDNLSLRESLLTTFAEETGLSASKNTKKDDLAALNRMVEIGAMPADLIGGIRYMRDNGFPILGLRSVGNPTAVEVSRRIARQKKPADEDYKQYTKGKYGKFVNNHSKRKEEA